MKRRMLNAIICEKPTIWNASYHDKADMSVTLTSHWQVYKDFFSILVFGSQETIAAPVMDGPNKKMLLGYFLSLPATQIWMATSVPQPIHVELGRSVYPEDLFDSFEFHTRSTKEHGDDIVLRLDSDLPNRGVTTEAQLYALSLRSATGTAAKSNPLGAASLPKPARRGHWIGSQVEDLVLNAMLKDSSPYTQRWNGILFDRLRAGEVPSKCHIPNQGSDPRIRNCLSASRLNRDGI